MPDDIVQGHYKLIDGLKALGVAGVGQDHDRRAGHGHAVLIDDLPTHRIAVRFAAFEAFDRLAHLQRAKVTGARQKVLRKAGKTGKK